MFLEGITAATYRHYGANLARICSRLIKAKNVWVACGDMGQSNVVRRDIRILPAPRRLLPLLSCDHAEGQECKHYGYSKCYDRFDREFHCNYVFCSDALRRNSFHPPPELNEVML